MTRRCIAALTGRAGAYLAPTDKIWDTAPTAAAAFAMGGGAATLAGAAMTWNSLLTPVLFTAGGRIAERLRDLLV